MSCQSQSPSFIHPTDISWRVSYVAPHYAFCWILSGAPPYRRDEAHTHMEHLHVTILVWEWHLSGLTFELIVVSELSDLRTSSILRYSKNLKGRRFESWIRLRHQVRGRHLLCWVRSKELTSVFRVFVFSAINYVLLCFSSGHSS